MLHLIDGLLDKGYCVRVDNSYTPPQLADYLIKRKTDIYSTLPLNRKNLPTGFVITKLKKGAIKAYQTEQAYGTEMARMTICAISSIHNPSTRV